MTALSFAPFVLAAAAAATTALAQEPPTPAQEPAPAVQAPTSPAPDAQATEDQLAQARSRVARALTTMMQLPSCGFAAEWGPDEPDKAEGPAGAVVLMLTGREVMPGSAKGAWSRDVLCLDLGDADDAEQVVFDGRRMIARDDDTDWTLRSRRRADGSDLGFAPDPDALLTLLATMDLDVIHREPGEVDHFPVEILTIQLTPDQVAELAWSGTLPLLGSGGGLGGAGAVFRFAAAAGAAGVARPAVPRPETRVDLALALDPGTGLLRRAHFRCYDKQIDGPVAGRVVFVGAAGGGGLVRAGGDDEEEEAAEAEATEGPLRFEAGLPVRPRQKTTVNDYRIDFTDHGEAELPTLDADARRLLGR